MKLHTLFIYFYGDINFSNWIKVLFCKQINQILSVVVALALEFVYEPFVYTVNGFLEGIDIHIRFLCECHAVFGFPAFFDLIIAGTVDVTFVLNSFLSAFINNSLLFWCQVVVDVFVDTVEQSHKLHPT